jgi:hypothetical protein
VHSPHVISPYFHCVIVREQFPEYIVGNIAFDQAVISIAVREGVHIVEATDTIHAFHQTGPEGNSAGQYATTSRTRPRARARAHSRLHSTATRCTVAGLTSCVSLCTWFELFASIFHQRKNRSKNRGPAKRHNQGLFRGPDTNGCKWTSCAQYHTAWRHPTFGSPDSVADSSDALPTPVIQKVQPGNSLLGVAHPIPDKVFASKCSVGHRGGGGGSGRTVMAQFQQRLPSLGEDEEDVHAFSFGLYLAQTCRMLICTPATQGSGPKLTSEYYRKQVASSGVIREYSQSVLCCFTNARHTSVWQLMWRPRRRRCCCFATLTNDESVTHCASSGGFGRRDVGGGGL